MKDSYRILASDREDMLREQKKTRLIVGVTLLISLSIFSYPLIKEYSISHKVLKSTRKMAMFLNSLKTEAITKKQPLEARFIFPNKIEIYETTDCSPTGNYKKLSETLLSQFGSDLIFLNNEWVQKNIQNPPIVLKRFCYDPLLGSSLHADGLAAGSVFLADSMAIQNTENKNMNEFFDAYSEIIFSGSVSDIQIQ